MSASTRRTRLCAAALAGLLVTVPIACGGPDANGRDGSAGALPTLVLWTDGVATAEGGGLLQGRIEVARGTDRVEVELRNAYPVAIPDRCLQSNVKTLHSYLNGRRLVCDLDAETTSLTFDAVVDGPASSRVGGVALVRTDGSTTESALPERLVLSASDIEPDLRLLSSPDFLNADVADLGQGPNRWSPRRSSNGTNAAYEGVLDDILDDWETLDPAAVLVAGDLVNGRWGYDDKGTGTFGPVDDLTERKAAVRRAARTYYPQWTQRFTDHGLQVFPTIGDHEMGDNPWGPGKRLLADTYRQEFARAFTVNPDGTPRYGERPPGPARGSAFAARPAPDVQIVSLDVFDINRERARVRIDRQQMKWLKGVLAKAQRDQVEWIIVESHVPIIFPVRNRASSALHYENGTDSNLWKVLANYGVDLYLSGEVHDTQLASQDGIVQISHGGAFQFGLTTALVLDFYGDNLFLTLRDYDVRKNDTGQRLWETRRGGLPGEVSTGRPPLVIGTASIAGGRLIDSSGILTPVD